MTLIGNLLLRFCLVSGSVALLSYNITTLPPSTWYRYYDTLDAILLEVDTLIPSPETTRFLEFLVDANRHLRHLTRPTKTHLLALLSQMQGSLDWQTETHVMHVLLLEILLRTHFPSSEVEALSTLMHTYAVQLVDQPTGDPDGRLLRLIFTNMMTYAPPTGRTAWARLQPIRQLQMRATPDVYDMRTLLHGWARLRRTYPEIQALIDAFVKEWIQKARTRQTVPLATLHEMVYIQYVRWLPVMDQPYFQEDFKTVTTHTVCPFAFAFTISQSPQMVIHIQSQSSLSPHQQHDIVTTISNAYHKLMAFRSAMPAEATPVEDLQKTFFLFADREAYYHFAPLWQIRTDNGGMTIRRATTIQAFIYQEQGRMKNLGHEAIHLFMYAWLPHLNKFPKWLMEGMADVLGNPYCYPEEGAFWMPPTPLTIDQLLHLDETTGLERYHAGALVFQYLFEHQPTVLTHLFRHTLEPSFNRTWLRAHMNQTRLTDFLTQHTADCREWHYQHHSTQLLALKEDLTGGRTQTADLMQHIDFKIVDVNTPFEHNNTLLHLAVNASDLPMVWQLLHLGSRLDVRNNDHQTPLELDPDNRILQAYIRDFNQLKDAARNETHPEEGLASIPVGNATEQETPRMETTTMETTRTRDPPMESSATIICLLVFPLLFYVGICVVLNALRHHQSTSRRWPRASPPVHVKSYTPKESLV